jgi:hypothetical protein
MMKFQEHFSFFFLNIRNHNLVFFIDLYKYILFLYRPDIGLHFSG